MQSILPQPTLLTTGDKLQHRGPTDLMHLMNTAGAASAPRHGGLKWGRVGAKSLEFVGLSFKLLSFIVCLALSVVIIRGLFIIIGYYSFIHLFK